MAKNSLYLLVKSMSKSEKRYVKLVGSTFSKKDNNYLILFDIIERQNKFDLPEIKQALKDSGVNYSYSMLRGYLYDFLLDTLQKYEKEDLEYELTSEYYKAKFLSNRGLNSEALKVITKLHERLVGLNQFHYMLTPVIALEANVMIGSVSGMQDMVESRKPLLRDWKNSIDRISELLKSREEFDEFYNFVFIENKNNSTVEERVLAFLENIDYEIEDLENTLAQYNYWYIILNCYSLLGDVDNVKVYLKKMLLVHKNFENVSLLEGITMQLWGIELWVATMEKDKEQFLEKFNSINEKTFVSYHLQIEFLFRKYNQIFHAINHEVWAISDFNLSVFKRDMNKGFNFTSHESFTELVLRGISTLLSFSEPYQSLNLANFWIDNHANKRENNFLGVKYQICIINFTIGKYETAKTTLTSLELILNRKKITGLNGLIQSLKKMINEARRGNSSEMLKAHLDELAIAWKEVKDVEKEKFFLTFNFERWIETEKEKLLLNSPLY